MDYKIIKMLEESELTGHDFVGVSEGNHGKLQVSVPYGISIPSVVDSTDVAHMRFLKTYVKAIQKALNSSYVKNKIDEHSAGMKHPLAAVNIICDYITIGLLSDYVVEEKRATSGKMDLNRTIQKIVPSYINGDLIYDEFIIRRKRIITDNYVANIQGNIINHFMNHGGELLFGTKLRVPVRPMKLDSSTILKLRRELAKSYNSRKQTIIRWMIEYIDGLKISEDSDKNGKWNYAIIASTLWEEMIMAVYGNQITVNKSKYGKRYSFKSITNGKVVCTGAPTQHDALYEDSNRVIIIDAKMYGNPRNLLSEEVLGKQFGYYVEAKRKNPKKQVINILFVPTIVERGEQNGFADIIIEDPHVPAKDDPDRVIYLYRCPANELIRDYYFSKKKYNSLNQEFESFIMKPDVREYLAARKATY